MARTTTPITDTLLKAAKPKDKAYSLYDGCGLLIEVRTTGGKFWRYKYKNPITGKDAKITLGEYPALTLKAARAKRSEFESMLANGLDPKQEIELAQVKRSNATSFEKITRLWHKAHTQKELWTSDTGHKTLRKFENHVFPIIGQVSIDEIKTKHLTSVISAIDDKGINRTARDIRANFVRIFSYAIQQGYIETNPARELDGLLVVKKKVHRPSLPLERLPELLQRIENYKRGAPITRLCMLLTLHIFSRSSEVRFARWQEIDFDKKLWIIPAKREAVPGVRYSERGAKMKEPHLVPLSPQAIHILRQIEQYSRGYENVFPSRDNPTKFISDSTVNNAFRNMGYDTKTEICGHGIRTMACGALIQSTLYSEDAVERQMSHKERNEVRASYTHMAEFLEERKRMMHWWSDYLDHNALDHITPYDYGQMVKQQHTGGKVIQFKKTSGSY